jgi:hypothetical protein
MAPAGGAAQLSSSNLPIVVINSQGRGYILPVDSFWYDLNVSMGIIDNGPGKRNSIGDAYNNYNGEVSIRVQGSSSVAFPKRSFRFSTLNAAKQQVSVSLLGMPEHEDWVLKALYQDKSFLRDDLAFRLFNQMGHYSSRGRFVEVVIDGEYKGVYQLLEKIRRDKNRVNIAKLKPEETSGANVTGGYIIAIDKYTSADKGWYSKHKSKGDSANFFTYVYPKPDSIMPQQMAYIRDYVDHFEDALAGPDYATAEGYRKYIDVPSFVDFFIVNELARNVDGYRASTFLHKDKETALNHKLKAGPLWDFNIAFGNCTFAYGSDPHGWDYQYQFNVNFVPFWWSRLMSDSAFKNDLRCRYQELRKNILSESALNTYIDNSAAMLDEAQQRNFSKYPILNQNIPPNYNAPPGSYAGEISYLKGWLKNRLTWMDTQLNGPCAVPLQETLDKTGEMAAYPNPFLERFRIAYKSTEGMNARVELLDLTGNRVMLVSEGKRREGVTEEEVVAWQLPAGYYFLKVTLNDKAYFSKVIKTVSR